MLVCVSDAGASPLEAVEPRRVARTDRADLDRDVALQFLVARAIAVPGPPLAERKAVSSSLAQNGTDGDWHQGSQAGAPKVSDDSPERSPAPQRCSMAGGVLVYLRPPLRLISDRRINVASTTGQFGGLAVLLLSVSSITSGRAGVPLQRSGGPITTPTSRAEMLAARSDQRRVISASSGSRGVQDRHARAAAKYNSKARRSLSAASSTRPVAHVDRSSPSMARPAS